MGPGVEPGLEAGPPVALDEDDEDVAVDRVEQVRAAGIGVLGGAAGEVAQGRDGPRGEVDLRGLALTGDPTLSLEATPATPLQEAVGVDPGSRRLGSILWPKKHLNVCKSSLKKSCIRM